MSSILIITADTRDRWRPSGVEYLVEALTGVGYSVELLDLAVEDRPEKAVTDILDGNNYYAIGISIFNTQRDTGRDQVEYYLPDIRRMIADIKRITDVPVILGGYGFSLQPEDILEYVGGDYGVAGCGIPATQHLLERIENGSVKLGAVIKVTEGAYLDFGFERNIVDISKYPENEIVYVGINDGCIADCYHCPFGSSKNKVRLRNPLKIVQEIQSLISQGIERIEFASCMVNVSVEYVESLCLELEKLPVEWSANILPTPKLLPSWLVDMMKRSGMYQVDIGSRVIGSVRMLEVYSQGFGTTDIEYAMNLFKERNITTSCFIGFGAPGETKQTIDETFNLIDKTELDRAEIITKARIYRNTDLHDIAIRKGFISPDDKLLESVYYPFSNELRDYICEEAKKRENCTVYY